MASEVEQIKERIDIVEYIGRSVVLKKAGRNFTGLCPFHGEHTPSFNVSPDRQIFKCFGCGVSGDVITFVMQNEGLDFGEALKLLAGEAGIELKEYGKSEKRKEELNRKKSEEERMYEMQRFAAEFYHWLLIDHESGREARDYLKGRGFEVEKNPIEKSVIDIFKIGYAPRSWDSLGKFLIKKGFVVEELIEGGLAVKSEKGGRGFYDMFRGRVMFPLYDKVGRIVGFSGRVLGNEKTAKYINTAETAIFHKREFLFGFYQAKGEIMKKGEVIVVEGEMDMLSSYQSGIRNVVAVKGSALTEEQILMLSRVSKKLLLCFDADAAGDLAMRKAIQLAEEKGMEVKVIQVVEGKDPDECIRKGVQYWIEAIESAVAFYDFLLQSAVRRYGLKSAEAKKNIVKEVVSEIYSIKNVVIRSHYLQRLSTIVGISEQELSKVVQNRTASIIGKNKAVENKDKKYARSDANQFLGKRHKMEEYFMALLLRLRKGVDNIAKKIEVADIDNEDLQKLYNSYTQYFEAHKDSLVEDFISGIGEESVPMLDRLFLVDITLEGEEELRAELFVSMKNLKELILREEMRVVAGEIKRSEVLNEGKAEIPGLQAKLRLLMDRLKRLQQI